MHKIASTPIGRLRKRAEFLRLRSGAKYRCRACMIQSRPRTDADDNREARFGITVTKKVGSAVERNRIRRRLREILRHHAGVAAIPGHDYVLVANRAALNDDFATIASELSRGLDRINRKQAIPPAQSKRANSHSRGKPDNNGT